MPRFLPPIFWFFLYPLTSRHQELQFIKSPLQQGLWCIIHDGLFQQTPIRHSLGQLFAQRNLCPSLSASPFKMITHVNNYGQGSLSWFVGDTTPHRRLWMVVWPIPNAFVLDPRATHYPFVLVPPWPSRVPWSLIPTLSTAVGQRFFGTWRPCKQTMVSKPYFVSTLYTYKFFWGFHHPIMIFWCSFATSFLWLNLVFSIS